MDVRLAQALLAAELPQKKSRVLIEELGSSITCVEELAAWRELSSTEKQRLNQADLQAAVTASAQGAIARGYADFPLPLQEAESHPPALFTWGDWDCAHAPTVAIVGTRGASTYGKAVAAKFAEALARAGVTIVSGGALGIDAAAHKGALSVGDKTIAVVGGGVDRVYPAMHRALFSEIRQNGCIVSQFPCGTQPNGYRFLVRNRLIAALSLIVLVVEAPRRSGALATANHANEIGRPVFVVPANIDNLNFAGSHALIRDGATLVDHPDQLLDAIGVAKPLELVPEVAASSTGEQILSVLTVEPLAIEFIAERAGLDMPTVLSELTMLELEGRILRDAGGFAIKP